jgi:hypothetical protein
MKNTKELIITNKESYLKPNEAVEIAYYLFTEHNAPATIKMAGKNKCVVTLDEPEMEENRYIKIKKDMESIKAEIYKTTAKHNKRMKRQEGNERRIAEEMKYNKESVELIHNYQTKMKIC